MELLALDVFGIHSESCHLVGTVMSKVKMDHLSHVAIAEDYNSLSLFHIRLLMEAPKLLIV